MEIKKIISELTRKDGSPIGTGKGSGYNINMDDAMTQTGDNEDGIAPDRSKIIKGTAQNGNRFYANGHMSAGATYVEGDEDEGLEEPEDCEYCDEDGNEYFPPDDEQLKESARNKMKDMLEDIMGNKNITDDMVKNVKSNEVRRNGIPPIETINDSNPIIVRKVNLLKDVLDRNSVSGEEKGIMLNHLLTMDLSDVPSEYKEELKKKLR